MSMSNPTDRVEIITSVSALAPDGVRGGSDGRGDLRGTTASVAARRHGAAPNRLFTWRHLVAQGGLTVAGSGEEVVPASDYPASQSQVRELHRLLGNCLAIKDAGS